MNHDNIANIALIGFYISTTLVVVLPIAAIAFAIAWVKVTRIRHCDKDRTQARVSPSA